MTSPDNHTLLGFGCYKNVPQTQATVQMFETYMNVG